jgi:cytochrome d ubiquinol oxidase subunit I
MNFSFDPVLLSRIQFAFTVSFHIIFPAFTIGLASFLAVLEGFWLKTKQPVYKELYQFWVKIFAVAFGMGVVSGVVMSYQFGTNWSGFSDGVGSVIGPLLGYEVLTAFFLEASFLGIMLFGWNRVGPKMHFASTLIVAIGTLVSAFWILSANSWMQTPGGFEVRGDGLLYPTNWFEVVFNPSFPYRFVHMIFAAYLTTAFVVGGIAAWFLWRNKFIPHSRIMLAMAMFMAVIVAPTQLFVGDLHGLNTLEHQPVKVAAMEGIWEDEQGAALRLFGVPNEATETTDYTLEIPKAASLLLTHNSDGIVRGLKSWPKDERPPVAWVFYGFRLMVGIGLLMILTGIMAIVLFLRKRLFQARWFQLWCMALTPAGFIAVLAGWFVTEIGRQPYVVYGVLRTSETASPVLGEHIALSLAAFVAIYTFVFGAGSYYILKLIGKGPLVGKAEEAYGQHGLHHPVTIADIFPGVKAEEKKDV